MSTPRKDWVRIGGVDVDPSNKLAMAVARAGASAAPPKRKFFDRFKVVKAPGEADSMSKAEAKRARKAAKRLQNG